MRRLVLSCILLTVFDVGLLDRLRSHLSCRTCLDAVKKYIYIYIVHAPPAGFYQRIDRHLSLASRRSEHPRQIHAASAPNSAAARQSAVRRIYECNLDGGDEGQVDVGDVLSFLQQRRDDDGWRRGSVAACPHSEFEGSW